MKKLIIGFGLICSVCFGCSDYSGEDRDQPEPDLSTRLTMDTGLTIDSSQVLFFRQLQKGDSLVCQLGIEGPKSDFTEHAFLVPAGYYEMVLIGNGEPEHIRFMEKQSKDSTLVEYTGGIQPPDLYYGTAFVKAGEQKKVVTGVLILTSRVALTIRQIPPEVKRIRAVLENTADGVYLNLVISPRATDPPISAELADILPGSSPTVHFRSLPSYSATDSTFLNVSCFDEADRLIYQGRSVSFHLGGSEDIRIACSFETLSKVNRLKMRKNDVVPEFLLR